VKKIITLAVIILIVAASGLLIFKIASRAQAKQCAAGSLSDLLAKAKQAEASRDYLAAKDAYQKIIEGFPSSRDLILWQKKLEELSIKIIVSDISVPQSVVYEVKSGDTLVKIARDFKTTVELIKKSNNLSTDKIVLGQKLRVWNSAFNILVDKSQNLLTLQNMNEVVKTYTVSTGANNCTPVGTFKIVNKIVDPTWYKAGAVVASGAPENILGTRWMGLDLKSYGIHGTTEPKNLGKQVTAGCVRMANPEVEELYTIVPVGTEVTIVD
jgi:hypothetical protein